MTTRPSILVLAWHLYQKCTAYKGFVDRYPYCRRYWWAAALLDHNAYVLDIYTWLTISHDKWLTRDDQPSAGN